MNLLLNIHLTYSNMFFIISYYWATMKRCVKFLSILTVVLFLAGCGLKGDLYFPENEQSTSLGESQ